MITNQKTYLDLSICCESQSVARRAEVVGHARNETKAASISGYSVGSCRVIQFVRSLYEAGMKDADPRFELRGR